jgi:hypothetical protein
MLVRTGDLKPLFIEWKRGSAGYWGEVSEDGDKNALGFAFPAKPDESL